MGIVYNFQNDYNYIILIIISYLHFDIHIFYDNLMNDIYNKKNVYYHIEQILHQNFLLLLFQDNQDKDIEQSVFLDLIRLIFDI